MENSHIQWTHHTFGWSGCEKVSPGCAHCYAEALTERRGGNFKLRHRPKYFTDAVASLKEGRMTGVPFTWDRKAEVAGERNRVFCMSQGDWLDPTVPAEWLADLLALIYHTPNLDWLLLTKRPGLFEERILAALETIDDWGSEVYQWAAGWVNGYPLADPPAPERPPHNVWVGTSVEDQKRALQRVSDLLAIPAAVRFLSCEPLLESIDIPALARLDWVICGGESHQDRNKARPFNLEWAQTLAAFCAEADVPFFMKQVGSYARFDESLFETRDPKGGDPAEWPAWLRTREFPVHETTPNNPQKTK